MVNDNPQKNDHWVEADDLLDRKQDALFLTSLLKAKYEKGIAHKQTKKSMVLAVDADWGAGKSFLLHNWALDLENEGHQVVRFNSWENDFSEDALSAFLAEMVGQLEDKYPKSVKVISNIKEKGARLIRSIGGIAGKALLRKVVGIGLEEISEVISEDFGENDRIFKKDKTDEGLSSGKEIADKFYSDFYEAHQEKKNSLKDFKAALGELVDDVNSGIIPSSKLPVFVFIDELDRCRPDFSVKLLEVVKHVFDVDGVYFVIALNQKQLRQSIKVLYGSNFDSGMYLKRFFDMEYRLKEHANQSFSDKLFYKNGHSPDDGCFKCPDFGASECLLLIFSYFNLQLRGREQVALKLFTIVDVLKSEQRVVYFPYLVILTCLNHFGVDVVNKGEVGEFWAGRKLGDKKIRIGYSGGDLKFLTVKDFFDFHYQLTDVRLVDWASKRNDSPLGNYILSTIDGHIGSKAAMPFADYLNLVNKAGCLG